MNPAVLTFSPTGVGLCLYTELIDLHAIGSLSITRATSIEFNASQQHWEVKDTNHKLLFAHASRTLCLVWEHQHFNR